MRKFVFVLMMVICCTQFAFSGEYKVLDQGRLNACTEYAVTACIDIMGEPTSINPITAYNKLSADGYNDITETLQYYKEIGAIDNYMKITPSAININQYLEHDIPVVIVTWHNGKDWIDGDITAEDRNFYGNHASVLEKKEANYYVGVNSWGENCGYGGKYHLYDLSIIGSAYIIVPKEEVVF